jgi:predicted nucleotidyltransferase
MNRIEIARQYVEELLCQRQDIVAVWIGGSVARGEETALSDIDLQLMVTGTGEMNRAGLDTWREGIYLEAGLVFQQEYADLEMVLNNPFKATHMNDALILYDPTGCVTQMQNAVRPLYMHPQWLGKRLAFWLDNVRTSLARFRQAVTAGDLLELCAALGWFTFGCASIPLLHAGITPSSTRGLLLLGRAAPTLKAQLAELEGSTQMSAADVVALEPLLLEMIPLGDASFGQLPLYFTKKTLWMAQQGQYQEALHPMWLMMYGAAEGCLQRSDPAERATGIDLAHRWLQRTHFEGAEVLAAKLQEAERLLRQVEELVENSGCR